MATLRMSAKQRRMVVLPAPDSNVEKGDRIEIGIWYWLFRAPISVFKPARIIFESDKGKNVFFSLRKIGENV